MSENKELKPCPFCGCSVSVERVPLKHYKECVTFEIKCLNCGCERTLMRNDSVYRTEKEARANAIAQWNERTSPDDDKPVVRGEWIDGGWEGDKAFQIDGRGNCWHVSKCSVCGFKKKGAKSNFCPNCGANMRKEANDV